MRYKKYRNKKKLIIFSYLNFMKYAYVNKEV